ncbi:GNAT family N-acetyltransferase [Acuticoccus sp. I52.16.1]|uniref:GNAT family N-acetyltransferase n=1 Tax=Acuticoccus sp. I52.16.1 TaxID=2928472 RepID=UPI001FD115F3|nr:GNAT family N-acetyltransferase [Acuticoccus sp. I52.16.1]UOM34263.1 GNAT family N-acetyltransferase [Acuticoccus sp. I52.16.1]
MSMRTNVPMVVVRRLRRSELPLVVDHFLRLDDESRRRRFCRPVNDAYLTSYVMGEKYRPGHIEGVFVDGMLRGIAELRPLGGEYRGHAEAAFSVERAFQQRGLGARLFERLVLRARNNGIHTLSMACLPENRAMQKLARRLGGALVRWPGEMQGTLTEEPATVFSMAREGVAEMAGAASATLDWWARYDVTGLTRRRAI